jgi:hypothetical protein
MKVPTLLAAAGALLASATAAFALSGLTPTNTSRPVAVAEKTYDRNPGSSCAGGQSPMLEVELSPAEAVPAGGTEALKANLKVTNQRGSEGRLRYAVELVTDTGKEVRAPRTSPIHALGARGGKHEAPVETGPLVDGYYQLRVTAASVAGADEDTATGIIYLRVAGGRITPIDVNDYLAESAANMEVQP